MGLAASQARLLTITSRLSNTELRQQQIANTKMRLSADQEQVSTKYSNALNNQTLTLNDAPMTYSDLVAAGYSVVRTSDSVSAGAAVSQDTSNTNVRGYFRMPKNAREFAVLAEKLGFGKTYSPNGASDINSTNEGSLTFAFTKKLENGQLKDYPNGYSHGGIKFHFEEFNNNTQFKNAIIEDAKNKGYVQNESLGSVFEENKVATQTSTKSNSDFEQMLNNSDFLIQGILSGYLTLMKDGQQVSLAGSKEISTVYDKSDDAQAEAEYNAAMAKINRKEKALDSEMKRLDTEHSALQTELESIKSIISDHAGKDFNLFS